MKKIVDTKEPQVSAQDLAQSALEMGEFHSSTIVEYKDAEFTPLVHVNRTPVERLENDVDVEILNYPRLGEISLHDLPHLLFQSYREGFNGRLVLVREGTKKEIIFEEGFAVFAHSNQVHDRLGELLHREGKITWDQYVQSLRLVKENKMRMGTVLVEKGYVQAHELFPLVKRHVAEIIYSLFSWSVGEYQFVAAEAAADEKIQLDLHPAALVIEGIRRKFSLDRLYQLVGLPKEKLVLHPAGFHRLQKAMLSDTEKRILAQFESPRTVGEVKETCAETELKVYQVAYGAMVLNALFRYGAEELKSQLAGRSSTAAESQLGTSENLLTNQRLRLEAKYKQVQDGNYFTVLGLGPEASGMEIERAYEQMRKDFSLSNFSDAIQTEMKSQLEEIDEVIEEAWQILRREKLREAYRNNIR